MSRSKPTFENAANQAKILGILKPAEVEKIARKTKWKQREGKIQPIDFLISFLSILCGKEKIIHLNSVWKNFNKISDVPVQYKPFYNRLNCEEFPEFMRALLGLALSKIMGTFFEPFENMKTMGISDIVLQDGSTIALSPKLAKKHPSKFNKKGSLADEEQDNAAVSLHLSMSLLTEQIIKAHLSENACSERDYLPPPQELVNKILVLDRGYPSWELFRELQTAGAYFVIRITGIWNPMVIGQEMRLKNFKSKVGTQSFDVDVKTKSCEFGTMIYRCVGLRKERSKATAVIITNLPRNQFSHEDIGKIYGLRWQIEILFKQLKSYCNLHQYDTSKSNIAMGFIYASLISVVLSLAISHYYQLVTGVALSNFQVGELAGKILEELCFYFKNNLKNLKYFLNKKINLLISMCKKRKYKTIQHLNPYTAGLNPCRNSLRT